MFNMLVVGVSLHQADVMRNEKDTVVRMALSARHLVRGRVISAAHSHTCPSLKFVAILADDVNEKVAAMTWLDNLWSALTIMERMSHENPTFQRAREVMCWPTWTLARGWCAMLEVECFLTAEMLEDELSEIFDGTMNTRIVENALKV